MAFAVRAAAACFAVTALLPGPSVAGSGKDDSALVEALRAGVLQWLDDVSFRSTFHYRGGLASSLDKALAGEIDPSIQGDPLRRCEGHGVFHKMGRRIHMSITYNKVLSLGDNRVMYAPVDAVTDGRLVATYFPAQDMLGSRVAVQRPFEEAPYRELAAGFTVEIICPLKPLWEPRVDPFEPPSGAFEIEGVRSVDERTVEVRLKWGEQPGKPTLWRRLEFRTDLSPPVLTRRSDRFLSPNGKESSVHAVLSGFRKCEGGSVAGAVNAVSVRSDRPIFVVTWKSDDLGDVAPRDSDFVLSFPPNTRLSGLKKAARSRVKTQLDVTKLAMSDVAEVQVPEPPLAAPQKRRLGTYLCWAFGGAILLLLLVHAARARLAKGIPPRKPP